MADNSIFISVGSTGIVMSKRCNETAFIWIDKKGERSVRKIVGLDKNKIVNVIVKLNLSTNIVVGDTNNDTGICHIESDVEFPDGEACLQEICDNTGWHLRLAHEKVKDDGRKNRKQENDGFTNGL